MVLQQPPVLMHLLLNSFFLPKTLLIQNESSTRYHGDIFKIIAQFMLVKLFQLRMNAPVEQSGPKIVFLLVVARPIVMLHIVVTYSLADSFETDCTTLISFYYKLFLFLFG